MKILVLKPSEISYNSMATFTQTLCDALNQIQIETVIVSNANEILSNLDGSIALITYNLCVSYILEGENLFDTIGIPIINFIVDHPRFHEQALNLPLQNLYVVCIDEDHLNYVKRHFPHVKGCTYGWVCSNATANVPYDERSIDVLFSGSFQSEKMFMDKINECGENAATIAFDAIEQLLSNTTLLVEDALRSSLDLYGVEMSDRDYTYMDSAVGTLVESFVRCYFRHKLISDILSQGIPITVYGQNWEKSPLIKYNNFIYKGAVGFDKITNVIAHSKVVLNANGWYKAGIHERVLLAARHGSICCTNGSKIIENTFTNKKSILLYPMEQPDVVCDDIRRVISKKSDFDMVSAAGYKVAMEQFNYVKVAERIVKMIS